MGDYEKLEQDSFQGSLSILHFDPSTSSGKIPTKCSQHNLLCVYLCAVRIALERRSDTSVQLKAAIAVEVVDYIVKNNWLAEVTRTYSGTSDRGPSDTLLIRILS